MAFLTIIDILIVFVIAVATHAEVQQKRLLLDSESTLDIGGELNQLKTQLMDQQQLIQDFQNTTSSLKRDLSSLTSKMKILEAENALLKDQQRLTKESGGAVYVRWGRNECPMSADIVYKGFSAGKHWQHSGDGSNTICLPSDPTWYRYVDGIQRWGAYIYGAEYETNDNQQIFLNAVYNEDLPCVVCQSKSSNILMIPARNNCYGNWTEEYQGYLMAAHSDTPSHNHICVDQDPDFIQGGSGNNNEHVLYLVESVCGSLPCPPYVQGRELACVVCSK